MAIEAVQIDSREPQWCKELKFGGVPTAVTALDAGDLLCVTDDGSMILIERKTCSDFLNTLRDERLFPQIQRMREVTPWSYVALCGDIRPGPGGKCLVDGRESGWNWQSVQGALLSVQELGTHIIYIASDFDYEASVLRLGNRDRSNMRIHPPRDITMVGEAEAILAAFPGIGPERAKLILEYCGTPADALLYLSDDQWEGSTKIPGIGAGTKARIRRALGLEDWAVLSKVCRDGTNGPKTVDKPLESCYTCGGTEFWFRENGEKVCSQCHPPATVEAA